LDRALDMNSNGTARGESGASKHCRDIIADLSTAVLLRKPEYYRDIIDFSLTEGIWVTTIEVLLSFNTARGTSSIAF
jgi:hypothetical protein